MSVIIHNVGGGSRVVPAVCGSIYNDTNFTIPPLGSLYMVTELAEDIYLRVPEKWASNIEVEKVKDTVYIARNTSRDNVACYVDNSNIGLSIYDRRDKCIYYKPKSNTSVDVINTCDTKEEILALTKLSSSKYGTTELIPLSKKSMNDYLYDIIPLFPDWSLYGNKFDETNYSTFVVNDDYGVTSSSLASSYSTITIYAYNHETEAVTQVYTFTSPWKNESIGGIKCISLNGRIYVLIMDLSINISEGHIGLLYEVKLNSSNNMTISQIYKIPIPSTMTTLSGYSDYKVDYYSIDSNNISCDNGTTYVYDSNTICGKMNIAISYRYYNSTNDTSYYYLTYSEIDIESIYNGGTISSRTFHMSSTASLTHMSLVIMDGIRYIIGSYTSGYNIYLCIPELSKFERICTTSFIGITSSTINDVKPYKSTYSRNSKIFNSMKKALFIFYYTSKNTYSIGSVNTIVNFGEEKYLIGGNRPINPSSQSNYYDQSMYLIDLTTFTITVISPLNYSVQVSDYIYNSYVGSSYVNSSKTETAYIIPLRRKINNNWVTTFLVVCSKFDDSSGYNNITIYVDRRYTSSGSSSNEGSSHVKWIPSQISLGNTYKRYGYLKKGTKVNGVALLEDLECMDIDDPHEDIIIS